MHTISINVNAKLGEILGSTGWSQHRDKGLVG